MKLKEFVSETLAEIVEGVVSAQEKLGDRGSSVNPRLSMGIAMNMLSHEGKLVSDGKLVDVVEFDVAVTITEGTETKGGLGIFVAGVGLGTQGQSTGQNSSLSRIKFSVPITLPVSK